MSPEAISDSEARPRDDFEEVRPRIRMLQAAFWFLVGVPLAIVGTYVADSRRTAEELTQTRARMERYQTVLHTLDRYAFTHESPFSADGRAELDHRLALLRSSLDETGLRANSLATQLDLFDQSLRLSARAGGDNADTADLRRRLALQRLFTDSSLARLRTVPRDNPVKADNAGMNPRATIDFAPGSAALDADAIETIATVATNLGVKTQSIVVAGNADTVGSDEFNYALAERRAEAVRRELEARIARPLPIDVQAYGERRLEEKTVDSISSPANRRAAIYLIE